MKSQLRLLDIIIFVAIISILAAIALPTYHTNMKRAKAYEAEITLDVLRDMLLAYYQQKKHYPISTNPIRLINLNDINIDNNELTGKFYKAENYFYISSPNGRTFRIKASGSKSKSRLIPREIDEAGHIFKYTTF